MSVGPAQRRAICQQCGAPYRPWHRTQRYCSLGCSAASRRKPPTPCANPACLMPADLNRPGTRCRACAVYYWRHDGAERPACLANPTGAA